VGSKFKDAEEFKLCFWQVSNKHNFNCVLQNNDGKVITAKCTDELRKWYVRAARLPHKVTYQVKVFPEKHSYTGSIKLGMVLLQASG